MSGPQHGPPTPQKNVFKEIATKCKNWKKKRMWNHQKHMVLKPLEAQSRGKTLEIIIVLRMQNMVHFENQNIIFVAKIHFDICLFLPQNPEIPKSEVIKN